MFSSKRGHYQPGEWVDFVRALLDTKTREDMQSHLDSGCGECRELAGFFAEVARRAAADAEYNVPDSTIRNLRGLYALQRPEEVRLLARNVARLVFDSFRQPALAGVRSQQHAGHQLMYVAGQYSIDLRLEHERGAPHVRMIGQIANRARAAGVAEVPVFLLARNVVVGKTATNKFGEFAMEYLPSSGLRLLAPIPGEDHIEVRLGSVSTRRSAVGK
jgi:hypothetical protein